MTKSSEDPAQAARPPWTTRPPPPCPLLCNSPEHLSHCWKGRVWTQNPSLTPGTRPSGLVCWIPSGVRAPAETLSAAGGVGTYPHELLGEGPAGVLWHVDGRDDPVSLLPPQPVGELVPRPRWQRVARGQGGVQLGSLPPLPRPHLQRREEPRLWLGSAHRKGRPSREPAFPGGQT